MVQISKAGFNKEMDNYLSKVKSTESEKKESKKKKKPAEREVEAAEFKEEEKEYYTSKKTLFQKAIGFFTGEEAKPMQEDKETEDISEEEKELEEYSKPDRKKGSVFSRLKGWFAADDDPGDGSQIQKEAKEEDAKTPKEAVPADIKEVLRIQNKWLMRLPAKSIKDFKDSEDYKIYKATLKKYGMIKVKDN